MSAKWQISSYLMSATDQTDPRQPMCCLWTLIPARYPPRLRLHGCYASLGRRYRYLGETNLAAENTKKAYELRERVRERGTFYIESSYCQFVTGDIDKARHEPWAQTYPRDFVSPSTLAFLYANLRQYRKALAEAREALPIKQLSAFCCRFMNNGT